MEEANVKPHSVIMQNREKLELTGICEVDSFSDELIVLKTEGAKLTIKGSGLKIERFSSENGDLDMTGRVIGLVYAENLKGSVKGRLFR